MQKWFYHDCFMQQHLLVSYAKNRWSDRNFWHSARLKSATFTEALKNTRIYGKFMTILLVFSLSERRAGWQKFLTDRQFLAYDLIWVLIWNYMHIWHSYMKIWPKTHKMKEKESFLIKNSIKWHIKIWYADMLQRKKSCKNDFIMIVLCSSIF